MERAKLPGRQAMWTDNGLHARFCALFPEMRTRNGAFDVDEFRLQMPESRSREAIYRWFRKNQLPNLNVAKEVIALATTGENIAALTRALTPAPKLEDLLPFVP